MRAQDEIAKKIQGNTDNIILSYLFERQKILLGKFNEFNEGTNRTFADFTD